MPDWYCKDEPTPFLLRVYYKHNAFIRHDDIDPRHPPKSVVVHTLPSCPLSHLALLIAAARPDVFPFPALGTRVVFQHLTLAPERSAPNRLRYTARDIGHIVLGGRGPGGLPNDSDDDSDQDDNHNNNNSDVDMDAPRLRARENLPQLPRDEALAFEKRSLDSLRFVPGDVLSIAVMPPLDDGGVAPLESLRRERERERDRWEAPRERDRDRDRDAGFARSGAPGRDQRRAGKEAFDGAAGDWRRGDRLGVGVGVGGGGGGEGFTGRRRRRR